MAAYHWYFVWAAYGVTTFFSLWVLAHSWLRMVRAERQVSDTPTTPRPENRAGASGTTPDNTRGNTRGNTPGAPQL